MDHIGSKGVCAERVKTLTSGHNAPFIFLTAIQVPGSPLLYLVMYWAIDPLLLQEQECINPNTYAFSSLIKEYTTVPVVQKSKDSVNEASEEIEDSYAFHNSRFKLIPRIVEGPWLVKRIVGSVPCLLGTKVTTRYYRGENYIETNVEVTKIEMSQKTEKNLLVQFFKLIR